MQDSLPPFPAFPTHKGLILSWDDNLNEKFQEFRAATKRLYKSAQTDWECKPKGDGFDKLEAFKNGVLGVSSAKLHKASTAIQLAVKSNNQLSYVLYARFLLEHTAMLFNLFDVMECSMKQLKNNPKKPLPQEDLNANMDAILEVFRKAIIGSRFDWNAFLTGGFSAISHESGKATFTPRCQQTNVLTWLQKYGKLQPQIMNLYELLCEAVHPNFGSNALFMRYNDSSFASANLKPTALGSLIILNTFDQIHWAQGTAMGHLVGLRKIKFA